MRNMILSAFVILSVMVLWTQVFAGEKKVLFISDIDDTIKVSNIISSNKVDVLNRAIELKAFTGMSQLYQLIINENINSTKVVYLSNAPKEILDFPFLQKAHEAFLKKNNFPKGLLRLRLDYKDQNHKINSIRKLVQEDRPDLVIMIGDNGERDTEIYHQAATELNAMGIQNQTYIHQLYATQSFWNDLVNDLVPSRIKGLLPFEIGQKIKKNQLGYVTPIEIAFDLKNKKLLNQSSLDWLNQNVTPYILNEKKYNEDNLFELTFPSFKNCSDHKFEAAVSESSEMSDIVHLVNSKCR